ncbi:thioredoxin-like 1-2, chloroplastic [Nicotiana tabacum]|uniref:Thioredoxin-like 1-2, chloroplastic n=2 Tax=Nicotiana TaxID=4085 RepID=A0A1S4DHR2_TOBAC|nr:PREDICTED: thioredoxin-like 1-2, chloroplastic [Nicotiana sylvestris]XP_016512915.1 PREDICTED: thioredoxin-like 1-2, chloroplastic [Nicotiana tabacum]
MACALNTGLYVCGPCFNSRATKMSLSHCSSNATLQLKGLASREFLSKPLDYASVHSHWNVAFPQPICVNEQESICVDSGKRWWEKSHKPNMVDINSAQQLVDLLLKAGDRLVIIDFYSPGCGGCKPLHPKICQLAESNPNAIFLKVNYEERRTICNALNIPVLPFFRFYRGAQGKVCSFSCTNATIKKFKDALAKYGKDRCSLGPARGLDESELLALASIGELSRNDCTRKDIFQESAFTGVVYSTLEVKEGTDFVMA